MIKRLTVPSLFLVIGLASAVQGRLIDAPVQGGREADDHYYEVQDFTARMENFEDATIDCSAHTLYEAGLTLGFGGKQCTPSADSTKLLHEKIEQALAASALPENAAGAAGYVREVNESARQYLEGLRNRAFAAIQESNVAPTQKSDLQRRAHDLSSRITDLTQKYDAVAHAFDTKSEHQAARNSLLSAREKLTNSDVSSANQEYQTGVMKLREAAQISRTANQHFEQAKTATQALIGGFEVLLQDAKARDSVALTMHN